MPYADFRRTRPARIPGTALRRPWRQSGILIRYLRVGYSASLMKTRTGKFLLVLAVLGLVVLPVRGAFALTAPLHGADTASHCSGMQHAMHANTPASAGSGHTVEGSGHCAGHGCDGTCCNGACVHPPVALIGAVPDIPAASGDDLQLPVMHRFARCTVSPLFRPPIPLPS